MQVAEHTVDVAKRSIKRLHLNTFEDRVLAVRITNGTYAALQVVGEPFIGAGQCQASFTSLIPGQAGTVFFNSSEGSMLSNATSRSHHAGAIEFRLGNERLFLGECCPLGQRFGASSRFSVEFFSASTPYRTLEEFYGSMPKVYMGTEDANSVSSGTVFKARISAIRTESPAEVEVMLLDEDVGEYEYELESMQQLEFAEWCQVNHHSTLPSVVFLAELSAVRAGLMTKKLQLADKAFAIDLLIFAFVMSGVLDLPLAALGLNLQSWQELRVKLNVELLSENMPRYAAYARLTPETVPASILEAYVNAGRMLLSAAAMRCSWQINDAVAACKKASCWPQLTAGCRRSAGAENRTFRARSSHRNSLQSINADFLIEHLCMGAGVIDPAGASEKSTHSLATTETASSTEASFMKELKVEDKALLGVLVRHCVHVSADFAVRRRALLEAMLRGELPENAYAMLRHFKRWLPLANRRFVSLPAQGVPEIHFESFNMEVFCNLDDSTRTSPEQVLSSMGYGAGEYVEMSTNSKSGELFLFSGDRRFIVKTVTEKECILLCRLMPAYQDHIRQCPSSLIVRFAGLFHVEVPGSLSQYFVVMSSIFDPLCKINETYDLKGSMHKRKKKPEESIGKDEDWVLSKRRLKLSLPQRRELCAVHELDICLLTRFKIMDYSLLIGIHHVEDGDPECSDGHTSALGISASDLSEVYFIGIIDFSIKYGIKKQSETLVNLISGSGESSSCVSEDTYAMRQARFVRDHVILSAPENEHEGTLGEIVIEVLSARDLVAADWTLTSDPYVRATVGLQSRRTHTILRNCNPEWNASLTLPLNQVHALQQLELAVWDEDFNRALNGSDDFLGKVSVPLEKVLRTGSLDLLNEKLLETKRGQLSVRLQVLPLSDHGFLVRYLCRHSYRYAASLAAGAKRTAMVATSPRDQE